MPYDGGDDAGDHEDRHEPIPLPSVERAPPRDDGDEEVEESDLGAEQALVATDDDGGGEAERGEARRLPGTQPGRG